MASTPLLGLSLPADGTTNWGTLVNTSITALLDSAIAGTTTLTTDADITLSSTTEATNEARQAIILWKPLSGTATRTITAPAKSKTYVVINATGGTQSIIFRGIDPITGPTTGVTIPAGKVYMLAWNGTDFVITGGVYGQATVSVDGLIKLGDATVQSVAANAVTATAARTYALQLNSSGQGVINVPWTDTTYTLPSATDTVLGGIKLGSATQQTTAASAVSTTASRTYALQVNASGQGVINVPWTDTTYTLPSATDTVLGGIKLGSATQQTTAANAVTATASRTYALQVNASGQGLVNVPWTDTVYTLPSATDTVLGGIKLGSATAQTIAANAVTATASRTYALQVNASGQGLVNVPWTDTTYTLPTATDSVLGGIKLGDATVQSVAANAVTATASRTYAVQLTSTGNAVVNVPWSAGSATNPGGSNTQVQYNNAGAFGGSANFVFDGTNVGIGESTPATYGKFVVGGTGSFTSSLVSTSTTLTDSPTFEFRKTANVTSGQFNSLGKISFNGKWGSTAGEQAFIFATSQNVAGTIDANTLKLGVKSVQGSGAIGSYLELNASSLYINSGNGGEISIVNGTLSYDGSTHFFYGDADFDTDITVNTLTVGKGPNNPIGTTTFGYQAGAAATANSVKQTAIGYRALASATTTPGVGNQWEGSTAVGYKALENSNPTFASLNTAVGAAALWNATTGYYNTAVGAGAASNVVTGTQVTAVGTSAGNQSTSGSFVAVGYNALAASINRTAGSVAIGTEALRIATTYSGNSAIFNENNTAVGHNTLYNLSAENSTLAGSNNTALGRNAGSALVSGSNNMMLGNSAQGSTTSISNEITLGNSSITTLRCQVTSITSLSDQRDKYDIEDLPLGLSFVNALRPRRYKWDKRDWYVDEVQHEDGTVETVTVPKDGSRAQTNWNEGFVAQEAKAALQAAGADWFPLVYDVNPEKLEMSSGKLIPVLVKAIQELTARIEALEAK